MLVDAWPVVCWVAPEGDVQVLQEQVHARQQTLRRARGRLFTGLALVHDDTVSQVGGHDEVVLHHEGRLLGVHDEALDHLGAGDALRLGLERVGG